MSQVKQLFQKRGQLSDSGMLPLTPQRVVFPRLEPGTGTGTQSKPLAAQRAPEGEEFSHSGDGRVGGKLPPGLLLPHLLLFVVQVLRSRRRAEVTG